MAANTSTVQTASLNRGNVDRSNEVIKAIEALTAKLSSELCSVRIELCDNTTNLSTELCGKMNELSSDAKSLGDEMHNNHVELLNDTKSLGNEMRTNHNDMMAESRRLKLAAMEEERADNRALRDDIGRCFKHHQEAFLSAPLTAPLASPLRNAHPDRSQTQRARSDRSRSAATRSGVKKSRKPIRKCRPAAARPAVRW